MQGYLKKLLAGLVALLVIAGAGVAHAQGASATPRWQPIVSVTPWGQDSSGLDGGGSFRARGAIVRAGAAGPIGGGNRAGLTLSYDHTDYDFSPPTAFGAVAPWGDVRRIGISAPVILRGATEWSYLVTPSVDYVMEDDAKSSEAVIYGAVLGAAKRFGPDQMLGLGIGAFDRLEELRVFPFILVDWRLTDRLRLANPLEAGPTGGAGLELSYQAGADWMLGGGAAYRSIRFRLDETGPFPNGIGEQRGIAGFVHAGRPLGGGFRFDLYAGAIFGGELRVENANGDKLISRDFDPAPFVGVAISARR